MPGWRRGSVRPTRNQTRPTLHAVRPPLGPAPGRRRAGRAGGGGARHRGQPGRARCARSPAPPSSARSPRPCCPATGTSCSPGCRARPHELVRRARGRCGRSRWPALLLPTGMISVWVGTVDDGWGGHAGGPGGVRGHDDRARARHPRRPARGRQYAAAMAATGLLYLAILTVSGTDSWLIWSPTFSISRKQKVTWFGFVVGERAGPGYGERRERGVIDGHVDDRGAGSEHSRADRRGCAGHRPVLTSRVGRSGSMCAKGAMGVTTCPTTPLRSRSRTGLSFYE